MRKLLMSLTVILMPLLLSSTHALALGEKGSGKKDASSPSKKGVYATLTWDAPVTNTDGSPLADLEGYNIYYRMPAEDKYDDNLKIEVLLDDKNLSCKKIKEKKEEKKKSRTECTYTVRRLKGGPYWFVVRAFNKVGKESEQSNEVKK